MSINGSFANLSGKALFGTIENGSPCVARAQLARHAKRLLHRREQLDLPLRQRLYLVMLCIAGVALRQFPPLGHRRGSCNAAADAPGTTGLAAQIGRRCFAWLLKCDCQLLSRWYGHGADVVCETFESCCLLSCVFAYLRICLPAVLAYLPCLLPSIDHC